MSIPFGLKNFFQHFFSADLLTINCISLGLSVNVFIYISFFYIIFLKFYLFYSFIFGCVGSSLLRTGFL